MNFIKRLISHALNDKITEENIDENAKKCSDQYLEESNSVLNSRSVNESLVGNNNNVSVNTVTNNSEGFNNVTDDIKENVILSKVLKDNDFNVSNVNDFEITEVQNTSFKEDCLDNIIDISQITSDGNLTDFETTELQNNSFKENCFDNIIDNSQMTLDGNLTDFETTEVQNDSFKEVCLDNIETTEVQNNSFKEDCLDNIIDISQMTSNGNLTDFETTGLQNNSFEEDCFDNIIDFSQMTSDGSLNNIILDNLTDSAEIDEVIKKSMLECSENQMNEVIHPEDNKYSNIILDDFEKLLDEEIEKKDIKDTIEKLVLLTENDCDYSLNVPQDDETKEEGDQETVYFIEIEGNLSIDNIPNNQKVVDDIINISSEEDLNLHSDLEIISISSQEESTKNNFTDNVNTDTESNLKSNCTEKKIDDTLQTNEINVENNITVSIDENSCSSYHSSDFEFITEEEAHKDCLINTDENINGTLRTIQINEDSGFNDSKSSSQNSAGSSCPSDLRNRRISDYSNDVARYENCNFNNFMRDVTDMSYRRNHIIPEGDRYLNLFQEIHSPTVPYMMENKTTRSSSMYVQYEGIGFDMRAAGMERNSDDDLAEEAEESEKIILTMYPAENRRKRRRF